MQAMRLDELISAAVDAVVNGTPLGHEVDVILDGNSFGIDHAELDTDGTFRIHLEPGCAEVVIRA